eukprot:2215855-Pleurochrysis_carterae.AAC.1
MPNPSDNGMLVKMCLMKRTTMLDYSVSDMPHKRLASGHWAPLMQIKVASSITASSSACIDKYH